MDTCGVANVNEKHVAFCLEGGQGGVVKKVIGRCEQGVPVCKKASVSDKGVVKPSLITGAFGGRY